MNHEVTKNTKQGERIGAGRRREWEPPMDADERRWRGRV